ncbi:hypothetical protein WH47_08409 [Habropoda laboriosa]|uniref:Uncharacterized protein n=1 Tax=Habropoda laboriosa TaxID=597456 RepID=A0A0L7RH32_9HYME|nr:hypothetical protein WH47_08409 [Habropoda laboriosa]
MKIESHKRTMILNIGVASAHNGKQKMAYINGISVLDSRCEPNRKCLKICIHESNASRRTCMEHKIIINTIDSVHTEVLIPRMCGQFSRRHVMANGPVINMKTS